jgi:hypothetical protein
MVKTQAVSWNFLEKWSSTLFTLAGILFLIGTGFFWLEDFVGPTGFRMAGWNQFGAFSASYLGINDPEWLHGLILMIELIPASLGLLGLYPRLSDRAPRAAQASAWIATLAFAAVVINLAWSVAVGLSLVASMPPDSVGLLTLVLFMLGFVSFGLASLRTGVHERTTGVLLVGYPPFLMGAFVTDSWVSAGLGMVIAAVLLSIGYVHTPDNASRDPPATSATAP